MTASHLWRADVGSKTHGWGSAASPVLYKDCVIINASVESESLVALNRQTGKEVWRAGGIKESWNTPILVPVGDGKQELVLAIAGAVLGFDPDTGEKLWSCATGIAGTWCPAWSMTRIQSTASGDDPVAALPSAQAGRGDVTATRRLWTLNKGSNVSSPVLHEGHLYFLHENLGVAYCAEAAIRQAPVRGTHRQRRAILFFACPGGGQTLLRIPAQRVFVLAAKPQYELLARNEPLDRSSFDASPAVDGSRLLIRSDKVLYCLVQD